MIRRSTKSADRSRSRRRVGHAATATLSPLAGPEVDAGASEASSIARRCAAALLEHAVGETRCARTVTLPMRLFAPTLAPHAVAPPRGGAPARLGWSKKTDPRARWLRTRAGADGERQPSPPNRVHDFRRHMPGRGCGRRGSLPAGSGSTSTSKLPRWRSARVDSVAWSTVRSTSAVERELVLADYSLPTISSIAR